MVRLLLNKGTTTSRRGYCKGCWEMYFMGYGPPLPFCYRPLPSCLQEINLASPDSGGRGDENWPGSHCSGQQISAMYSTRWQQSREKTDFCCCFCFLLSWPLLFSGNNVRRRAGVCAEVMMGQGVSVSKRDFPSYFSFWNISERLPPDETQLPTLALGWRDPRLGQDPTTDS